MILSKKMVLIFVVLFVVLFAFDVYLFKSSANKASIVYVDLKQLHKDFVLTKDLELKLRASSDSRDDVLDSVKLIVETLSRQFAAKQDAVTKERYTMHYEDYIRLQQQYKSDNDFQANQYDTQIWNQLNQSIEDYRKETGYDFILGTSGSGNIMSANSSCDITKELIEYANKKYAGK